jgi:hypothetical protein
VSEVIITMVTGEPEAAAPADPAAKLVTPTPAVKASAASPNLPLCLPYAIPMVQIPPREVPPDAKSGS